MATSSYVETSTPCPDGAGQFHKGAGAALYIAPASSPSHSRRAALQIKIRRELMHGMMIRLVVVVFILELLVCNLVTTVQKVSGGGGLPVDFNKLACQSYPGPRQRGRGVSPFIIDQLDEAITLW